MSDLCLDFSASKSTSFTKGKLISKADWRNGFSQKMKGRISFVCFFTLHGKQIKFVCSFFGRIYGSSICFLTFFDLQQGMILAKCICVQIEPTIYQLSLSCNLVVNGVFIHSCFYEIFSKLQIDMKRLNCHAAERTLVSMYF